MAYSIQPILHNYADKNNLYRIYLRLIFERISIRVNTHYKVKSDQFENGFLVNHPNKTSINRN
ncbi:MAG TPA: hypothetical protein VK622_02030, partial [Puia sp.]|nr:hypothetical protein [Puia sp.]